MKRFFFVGSILVSLGLLVSCSLSSNQSIIEGFVNGANEELASLSDTPGIKSSKCEYCDGAIWFNYVLDIQESELKQIDITTLQTQYLEAYQTDIGSEPEYAEVFEVLSEEQCMIKFKFQSNDGGEICFEINPKDIIKGGKED